MEQTNINRIFADLEFLKQKMIDIESRMIDVDCIMTSEEEANFNQSLRELEKGETISLEDFEREMKNAKG